MRNAAWSTSALPFHALRELARTLRAAARARRSRRFRGSSRGSARSLRRACRAASRGSRARRTCGRSASSSSMRFARSGRIHMRLTASAWLGGSVRLLAVNSAPSRPPSAPGGGTPALPRAAAVGERLGPRAVEADAPRQRAVDDPADVAGAIGEHPVQRRSGPAREDARSRSRRRWPPRAPRCRGRGPAARATSRAVRAAGRASPRRRRDPSASRASRRSRARAARDGDLGGARRRTARSRPASGSDSDPQDRPRRRPSRSDRRC